MKPADVIEMKTYIGENTGAGPQKVTVNTMRTLEGIDTHHPGGYELPLNPSLALYNQSPTGFQWGYAGSGPAQLALAILLDLTGDPELSVKLHQDFKRQFLAVDGKLVILEPEIREWLEANKEVI